MILILFSLLFSVFSTRDEIIVVSDIHMGGFWFDEPSEFAFSWFLKQLTDPNTKTHTLVLNGDIIDLWMFNFTYFQSAQEIMTDPKFVSYFDQLKEVIDNNVTVVYIAGNHDFLVEKDDFDAIGLGDIEFYDYNTPFIKQNIRIQHGGQFDIFNAYDPSGRLYPFGFYLSRAFSEGIGEGDNPASGGWFNWVCENLLPYAISLVKDSPFVLEKMFNYALGGNDVWGTVTNKKYKEYKNKQIEHGCFYKKCKETVILEQVVQKYRSLFGRWFETRDKEVVRNMFRGYCGDMGPFIQMVDQDIFVQGHTHTPLIKVYKRKTVEGGNVVYGNTGSWESNKKLFSMIKIKALEEEKGTKVGHYEFDVTTGEHILIDEVDVVTPVEDDIISVEEYEKSVEWQFQLTPPKYWSEERDIKVPEEWKCDKNWYKSGDGCDCNCGIWDPDCGQEKEVCEQTCKK